MSNTQTKPWSDNPNAPKIPYGVYFAEKADFIGLFLSAILYGTSKTLPPTRQLIRVQFVRSRDSHCAILPMYGRAT